jgi:hypothetical protein
MTTSSRPLASRAASVAQTPEEHAHLGTLDNCGFAAGLGMAVSIYHKLKTGQTTRSRTSRSPRRSCRSPSVTPDARSMTHLARVLGHNALSHFYKTSEGRLYLDSKPAEVAQQSASRPGRDSMQQCWRVPQNRAASGTGGLLGGVVRC